MAGEVTEPLNLVSRRLPRSMRAVAAAILAVSQLGPVARTQQKTSLPWADFGVSVAAVSDTIFVAASQLKDGQRVPGTVHIFQRRESRWVRAGVLPVPEARAEDPFGVSMATDGETLVVGAHVADTKGDNAGLAYVFERRGENWQSATVLSAGDAKAGDQFGLTVSVSGDTIAVGARLADSLAMDGGATYVFARRAGRWPQIAKLVASDAASGDIFGRVSVDADTMLVTADLNDDRGPNAGKAYAFENRRGQWVEVAKMTAGDGAAGDEFGFSLAVKGHTAVFGAIGSDARGNESGAAYVFEGRAGMWAQTARLTASDGGTLDVFGSAVAVAHDTIVVGAPNHGGRAGAAYVFERRGDGWTETGKLTASDAAAAMRFGNAVAIGQDMIVVGMLTNGDGKRPGAAYVFERREGRWLEMARLIPG